MTEKVLPFVMFLLLTGGTVGATLGFARTDPTVEGWERELQVDVPLAVVSLSAIALGGVLRLLVARARSRQSAAEGGRLALLTASFESLLDGAARLREALEDDGADLGLDGLHAALDELLSGPLPALIENRQALIDEFGVGGHARVMGPLAAGERRLNRAWSASTDGYFDEAVSSVFAAREFLDEARRALSELMARRRA